jgi:hypothetical protein
MKLTNKQLLNTIEGLYLATDSPEYLAVDKLRSMLDTIYRIIHSHISGICYDTHGDWRKEGIKIYKELIKQGIIGNRKHNKTQEEIW